MPTTNGTVRENAGIGAAKFWITPIVVLGGLFAFLAPRGLAYDEPAHWQNVLHIATNWSLPRVGVDENIGHEGVQAPLAYLCYAAWVKIGTFFGIGEVGQFYLARISGLLWLWLCCVLTERLIQRCRPRLTRSSTRVAVSVVLLNPMLLAVAASIQNDILALALAVAVFDLSFAKRDIRPLATGAIIGLALLTKITIWPIAVAGAFASIRSKGVRATTTMTATACAVFGWWPLRNVMLYGDPTGASSIERLGISFPPLGWQGPDTLTHLARSAVTFLWIPVEYYRNLMNAPGWIEVLVLLSTALVAGGACRAFRAPDLELKLLLLVGAGSVSQWILMTIWVEGASFRIAYAALFAWAVAAATTCTNRALGLALGGMSAVMTLWTLLSLAAA